MATSKMILLRHFAMPKWKNTLARWLPAIAICGVVLVPGVTCAHDAWGLGHHSIELAVDLDHRRLQEFSRRVDDDGARYVIVRAALWDPGAKLLACFYEGGNNSGREQVVTGAALLLSDKRINIAFDFGEAPVYRRCSDKPINGTFFEDVRISFVQGCCAAYVGRQAHDPIVVAQKVTVFVQGIEAKSEGDAKRIVMHEFLHVLGFHHQHQSPASRCADQIDTEAVKTRYGWTDEKIQANFGRLDEDARSYKWSEDDSESILKYYIEADFLKDGANSPCYTKVNMLPSKLDYDGLRDAYPSGVVASSARQISRAGAATALTTRELPPGVMRLLEVISKWPEP